MARLALDERRRSAKIDRATNFIRPFLEAFR